MLAGANGYSLQLLYICFLCLAHLSHVSPLKFFSLHHYHHFSLPPNNKPTSKVTVKVG
jgi:hypothetical protein